MIDSYNEYIPKPLPISEFGFIAPYWADVDLRGSGDVYYRQTTDPILLARACNEIQRAYPSSQSVTNLLIVTWSIVGYYNSNADKVSL